jgi:hypothetical protein
LPDRADENTIEELIKQARLQQLALLNAKAQEEAALRSGRYVLADEARQSAGRIASRMVTMFEGALGEFANANSGEFGSAGARSLKPAFAGLLINL